MAALCAATIVFLAIEITRDLRLLSSARSDNAQWTLSQAEVEFLDFQFVVEQARNSSDPDLASVRREFDIFYSRIRILARGDLYAPLRGVPEFDRALTASLSALDQMIPIIDGPDQDLTTALAPISEMMALLRPAVRELANSGLHVFAEDSDDSRIALSYTLLRLGGLAVCLVIALLYLLQHARKVGHEAKTRRSEAEGAFRRLNTVLQTSLDAVVVANKKGAILQVNAAAEKIFLINANEVVGKSIGEIFVPDHLRDAHEAGMARHAADGSKHVVGHGRVRLEGKRQNGEVFPVELALETAQSGDEDIIIGFLRDISPLVEAENELVDARDKAVAGEKAKADFLAMMTHEIRTPLNGVLGNLSLLEDTNLSERQARYTRNMDISGKLLMAHVDAVLDIARFESGATQSRTEPVHIGHLMQDIVDSQLSAAEAHGNLLEWSWIGPSESWIEADPSRLQQVILNLVGNAIKFTRNGRIAIELERSEGDGSGQIEIRIIDTGIGISEEDLPRVFNDFESLHAPLEDGVAGTGLGLGIARRFVEAIGGEIGAESTLGEGSVFWFTFPFKRAEAQLDSTPEAPTLEARALTILVVEDNEINLHLTNEILTRLGHEVIEARNGQEAVHIAETQAFDLILMDIRMPVMDGLAATKAIRDGNGPCKYIPIVALSANVLPDARDRFTAGGMSGFLGKPLNRDELQIVLNNVSGSKDAATAAPKKTEENDAIRGFIDRYLVESKELFDWLDTTPDDLSAIADRCHMIAGSAAAFGQADLREVLVQVERHADAGDQPAMLEAIRLARKAWKEAPEPSVG
ncbi:hybrid sensor histidine kinase/response regulator [Actibacterium pelagium]|uniref:hybrid sensor histidine kinase/response regulator n=1 Tax=Actibacterium pelagium TaxID=2029103 RepID=UPI001E41D5AF|nr:ATP-binding protein [Actibacterium pelagium]